MRLFHALAVALFASGAAFAQNSVLDKSSPHDVATTMDRLEQAVKDAGAAVIARVDHAGAAEGANMDLRPTQLLIFGKAEMGTPLMQYNQQIGLEVPLRVAVYEDSDGDVHVIYENMAEMASAYGMAGDDTAVANVTAALEKLTDAAVAQE